MKKYIDSGKIDTRSGFGVGLYEAGKADPRVVALTADLKGSLKMDQFAAEFPDRFIQCGIAESNMVGAAAGLAVTGKIPFIGSFAEFVSGRVYDQVRQEVGYGHTNVKIASSHAGITLGEDGAKQATIAAAKYDGPVYLRFGRPSWPNFTPDEPFEIGKAYIMNEGSDVTIIACGHLVWESIKAAEALEAEGISAEVINIATIKPLDEAAVLASALKTKAVVVAEEHNSAGGIGELVAGVLAKSAPTPMEFLNGEDKWGQSGTPAELLAAYGLDAAHIVLAAKKAIARK